ncbi:hypothetical protein FA15DRAFT_337752 [Coprinopsis marcescibilis]|uniref:Mid2 domain-containing protein n=1 Tax=Coprinopsis marcescibilis TaxID=230819 RepID=A0A5C3KCF0_COPMA|nr:hypothetical protein FA15DRAFT_337752 [Coprinopsis marcescibilis]
MLPQRCTSTTAIVQRLLAVTFLTTALSLPAALAQAPNNPTNRPSSRQFQWQFTDDTFGSFLPTCRPLGIRVLPWDVTLNDTFGVPPFYMLAYEVGGTPQTSFIGTDNTTLSYTVRHPPGSRLILNVVDASGSSGGIPPRMFDVVAGQSLQCVVPTTVNPEFSVKANVTGDLESCQQLGVTVKGGTPPYTLNIVAVNSPVVTNATIPLGLDAFTYINRADPGREMIVAVSDVFGRWATGTPLVNTRGSTNVDCTGLVSSPGNSTVLSAEARAREAQSLREEEKKRSSVIAGVTVPLILLLLGGIGGYFWWRRRQAGQNMEKRAFDVEKSNNAVGSVSSITPFVTAGEAEMNMKNDGSFASGSADVKGGGGVGSTSRRGEETIVYTIGGAQGGGSSSGAMIQSSTSDNGPIIYRYVVGGGGGGGSVVAQSEASFNVNDAASDVSSTASRPLRMRPSFASFPATPTRRAGAAKAAEAAMSSRMSPDSEYPPMPMPSIQAPSEEIIIQHRDGGTTQIRELPPPYADSSLRR